MKSTVPLNAEEPGNVKPALARSKRRFVRIAGASVAVLVVVVIIGSFSLLFASHHPGTGKASSVTPTTQPNQSPPYSYSWTRVSNVLFDHGQLYVPQGDLLRVLSPNNGTQSGLYHFPRAEWTPVIDHGTIYMVTESGMYSYVEAWRASDSVLLWRYQMNCCARSLVPLVVTNGVVYVSEGSVIGAITALRASNGSRLWSYPTNGPIGVSLTVANDIVYGGSRYALRASNGSPLWLNKAGDAQAQPIVQNGVLYVGSQDGSVYAYRVTDGSLLWKYATDYAIMGSAIVDNGVVYVGTGNNSVYAIRAENGTLLWHVRTNNLLNPMPRITYRNLGVFVGSVGNGAVYIGSEDGYVLALNSNNGAQLWHFETGDMVVSPSVSADGLVYVYSDDGYTNNDAIYALHASDGTVQWHTNITIGKPISPPSSTGITPHLKGIPAFTTADVEHYIQANGFAGGPTVSGAPPTILKILFVSSKQASDLMHGESTGLPDDALVCYVELRGPFNPVMISEPPGASGPQKPVEIGEEVFDAETGNLLVWGF
jgi:outer membrane protein assembly factor BamB